MAYDSAEYKTDQAVIIPIAIDTPEGTAGDDVMRITMPVDATITSMEAFVTETVAADATAPVISILVGAVSKAAVTLPDATAVGTIVAGVVASADVDAGDVLIIDKTTLATDASTASGICYVTIHYKERYDAA